MDDEKPKRRWFQFHLSTVVVLMILLGGLYFIEIGAVEWKCKSKVVNIMMQFEAGKYESPVAGEKSMGYCQKLWMSEEKNAAYPW